jgi:TldD protein
VDTPVVDLVALLGRVDKAARAYDPHVTSVLGSIGIEHRVILIATPDGRLVGDVRPLVHLSVTCIAERDGVRQQGTHGGGGRFRVRGARSARGQRSRATPPASRHEPRRRPGARRHDDRRPRPRLAGHPAARSGRARPRGDFNRKGTSTFSNRIGTRVASDLCTVIDDGTIAARRGSLNVDDEGTPTQRTVLIENGILRGYLQDSRTRRSWGCRSPATGDARASRTFRCRA